MKKKIFAILVSALTALSLGACGSSSTSSTTASSAGTAAESAAVQSASQDASSDTESVLIEADASSFAAEADVTGKTEKNGVIFIFVTDIKKQVGFYLIWVWIMKSFV